MKTRNNPPWSDKILSKHWAALEARVGAKWMPVASFDDPKLQKLRKQLSLATSHLSVLRAKRDEYARVEANHPDLAWMDRRIAEYVADCVTLPGQIAKLEKRKPRQHGYREYGCGHYGCVMPTQTPGIVVKVTTDKTEAAFVAAYLSLSAGQCPVGIIPYHKIVAVRGESRLKRPVFILWRDEAQYLGADGLRTWIAASRDTAYFSRSFRVVVQKVLDSLDAARAVRQRIHNKPDAAQVLAEAQTLRDRAFELGHLPSRAPRPLAIAWFLNKFQQAADDLQSEPMGNYIGRALSESLEAGLLLADVHLDNIGMPAGKLAEEIGMTPIITDPGHAIALDDRYAGVQVEEL